MNFFLGKNMHKEVGASGQGSVNKTHEGKPFDLQDAVTNAQWVEDSAPQIAQYNDWAQRHRPYSQRVREWRQGRKLTIAHQDTADKREHRDADDPTRFRA